MPSIFQILELPFDAAPDPTDVVAFQKAAGGIGSTRHATLADFVAGSGAGGPGGSGTDNRLVRWDGTSDIQDSKWKVLDDGTTYNGDFGNARGAGAVDFQLGAGLADEVASGQNSFIGGGSRNLSGIRDSFTATRTNQITGGAGGFGRGCFGMGMYNYATDPYCYGSGMLGYNLRMYQYVVSSLVVGRQNRIEYGCKSSFCSGVDNIIGDGVNAVFSGFTAGGFNRVYGFYSSAFGRGNYTDYGARYAFAGGHGGRITANSGTTFGDAQVDGGILVSGLAGFAHGSVTGTGQITASGVASIANGHAKSGGSILALYDGAQAHGYADNGTITAQRQGTFVTGVVYGTVAGIQEMYAYGAGTIMGGSVAGGGYNASIRSYYGRGTLIGGSAVAGHIRAANGPCFVWGKAEFGQSRLTAELYGSIAVGSARRNGAYVEAIGRGAQAFGYADFGGGIRVYYGHGALARGRADTGYIIATGQGSYAGGYAFGGTITSTNDGSWSGGFAGSSDTMTSSGVGSFVHGIAPLIASGDAAHAIGEGAEARLNSQFAHGSGDPFSGAGLTQRSELHMTRLTTNATPAELTIGGGAPSSSTRFLIDDGRALDLIVSIIGRETAGANIGRFLRRVCIERTGAATVLVGGVDTLGTDVTPAGWVVAITADDPNDSLAITVTGTVTESIRWSANIMAAEVVFT